MANNKDKGRPPAQPIKKQQQPAKEKKTK